MKALFATVIAAIVLAAMALAAFEFADSASTDHLVPTARTIHRGDSPASVISKLGPTNDSSEGAEGTLISTWYERDDLVIVTFIDGKVNNVQIVNSQ